MSSSYVEFSPSDVKHMAEVVSRYVYDVRQENADRLNGEYDEQLARYNSYGFWKRLVTPAPIQPDLLGKGPSGDNFFMLPTPWEEQVEHYASGVLELCEQVLRTSKYGTVTLGLDDADALVTWYKKAIIASPATLRDER